MKVAQISGAAISARKNKMTNKFLEDAARALIHLNEQNGGMHTTLEKLDKHNRRAYLEKAQAVFDSAKILLLPADAEAEVGDGVLYHRESTIGEKEFSTIAYTVIDDARFVEIFTVYKIIARKGYNSVLQEGE